jgi:glycosyltransferase involved in cell wall biosynthesis
MSDKRHDGPIPIVVLHRDEPGFLRETVAAIRQRTSVDYQLFVVDNNSVTAEAHAALEQLASDDVVVIRNSHNRWVMGFNSALAHERFNHNAAYYVFSDGDIVVPDRDASGACWLSRLIDLMNQTACAGKIGLSLNLVALRERNELAHIYQEEIAYGTGPRIGNLVIAPIDTTLAIYRKDLFVMNGFRFLPGHKSLLRPYYYCLRTPLDFSAIHLGWEGYGKRRDYGGEKIRCFARFGGFVDRVTLATGSVADRCYYKCLGPLWRFMWGLVVAYHWFLYIAARFPRGLNELQAQARTPSNIDTARNRARSA